MKFYNFFCSSMLTYMYGTDMPEENQKPKNTWEDYRERDIEEIEADLNDFYYETGLLLSQCGFEQMYARNPFDWLMLYCASYMEGIVNACFAIETRDSVANFTYLHDKWDLYKAVQLSETTFKIENWGRFDAGEDGDSFGYDYDVCVISTSDTSADFKWLDDTHTAFSITLHDKENSYWTEECLVTFVVSSTE